MSFNRVTGYYILRSEIDMQMLSVNGHFFLIEIGLFMIYQPGAFFV